MNIFKFKKKKKVGKGGHKKSPSPKGKMDSPRQEFRVDVPKKSKNKKDDPLLHQPQKYDLLDEIQRERDDEIDEEGYSVEKKLVIEAWKRFRPVNKQTESDDI